MTKPDISHSHTTVCSLNQHGGVDRVNTQLTLACRGADKSSAHSCFVTNGFMKQNTESLTQSKSTCRCIISGPWCSGNEMKKHNEVFSCGLMDTAVVSCIVYVYYYKHKTYRHFWCHEEKLPWGVTKKTTKQLILFNLKMLTGIKYSNQTELESVMGKCASLIKPVFSAPLTWAVELHWYGGPKTSMICCRERESWQTI